MSDVTLTKGGEWLMKAATDVKVFTPEMFSAEQKEMYNTAAKFAREEVHPKLDEMDHAEPEKKRKMNADLLRSAGEVGLLMIDIPEEYGGLGADKTTSFLIAEAIAREGGNFTPTHGAHTGIGTLPILFFGNEEQKQKYLPGLATGEIMTCYGLTEESAGSDAMNAKTRAVLSEDGKYYVLNGVKQFITNSGFADIVIVFAKIDGEAFTGFIVHKEYEGFSIGAEEKKMGLKSNSTCQVIMEDCKVPVENMLYEPGKGHKIAFNILNIGRGKLGAGSIGGAKGCLKLSINYALERKQFNKPIAEFTMIREKIANMFIKIYSLESMSYRTSGLWDLNTETVAKNDFAAISRAIEEYTIEASILKVFGSEVLDYCVDEGLQIHGGYGYIAEYEIERAYRDSRVNRIFEGTNEVNRMLIPGTMAKMAMKQQLPLMDLVAKVNEDLAADNLPTDDGSLLGAAKAQNELMKMLSVYCSNAAMMKFMMGLKDEQEILRILADMLIEAFASDSNVARALQKVEADGEQKGELQVAATAVYSAEAHTKVVNLARELLADCFEGDELNTHLANIDKMAAFMPVNTMTLRRKIADKIIDHGDYLC